MSLNKYVIDRNNSIQDALGLIDANHLGFLLIKDEFDKIIGIVTDGDIRRSMIKGASLLDEILCCINNNFISYRTICMRVKFSFDDL